MQTQYLLQIYFACAYPSRMDMPAEIVRIENRVRAAGKTVKELLRIADVDDAQWWRWRQGKHRPLRTTWARIVAAVDEIAPKGGRI